MSESDLTDAELLGEDEPHPPAPDPNDAYPPVLTASELLAEDDPLAAIPQEPPDEDTPPDEGAPTFINRGDIYSSGKPSILMADGTPLGVWLDREHHDLDGYAVKRLLRSMGLQDIWSEGPGWYAHHRDKRIEADKQIAAHPAIQAASVEEAKRKAEKQKIQEAFIKAKGKKV